VVDSFLLSINATWISVNKKATNQHTSLLERAENLHPYKMLLILGLVGSGIIFLFLLFSFFISTQNVESTADVTLSPYFLLSSVVIITSSFIIQPITKFFRQEHFSTLLYALRFTLFMGLLFGISQLVAWMEMARQGLLFTEDVSGSFLYVITGMHGLHLLIALGYLVVLIYQTQKIKKDPIKILVAVSNPYWHLKYELITKAWHFLGAIWFLVYLSFLIFL
jgi:cytochrome c oxidase subunit 3